VDLLRMPPQVHLVQDGQVTKIALAIFQMACLKVPLYAIMIGVPLEALEARPRLSCCLDVLLGGAEFLLPRLRLPLAGRW
jgi:hypothetical protein